MERKGNIVSYPTSAINQVREGNLNFSDFKNPLKNFFLQSYFFSEIKKILIRILTFGKKIFLELFPKSKW